MYLLKFQLTDFERDFIFNKAYRSKQEIINLLLYATKIILNKKPVAYNTEKSSYLFLIIDKMSRIVFFKKNKSFSITFPFQYFEKENDEGKYPTILMKGLDYEINNIVILSLETILQKINLEDSDLWDILSFLEEIPLSNYEIDQKNYNSFISKLFFRLILSEDGYLRYDYDELGFKPDKPHLHPLHHLDIFYSSNPTFKIGLKASLSYSDFIKIIDIKTDCKYLVN
ncbi:hypothetical protein R4578_07795 [Acinetobacter baumannii]|nr:hypothetical protein [Acinetobacter baumannii]